MNYYQHHIGDFIRDTARLSDAQSMAYLRMIWLYYETEEPLDCDADALAFKIGASASDVHQILKHFFFEFEGKWHHSRCNKEILAFREKSKKAKESASARWNNAKAMRSHSDCKADEAVPDANQEPITNNQEPEKKKERAGAKPAFDVATGKIIGLTEELITKWSEAYPAVCVRSEISKAEAWLMANPKNRKSEYVRFLNSWLSRAQDKAPRVAASQPSTTYRGGHEPRPTVESI